jgi:hypothetical protein
VSYNKLLWALLGTGALAVQTALSDDHWTSRELIELVAALLAAFGTWLMPNTTLLRTAKTWINALLMGLAVLVTFLDGGVTGQEWMTIVLAVLTAAGVYAAPRAPLYAIARPVQRGDLPPPLVT